MFSGELVKLVSSYFTDDMVILLVLFKTENNTGEVFI